MAGEGKWPAAEDNLICIWDGRMLPAMHVHEKKNQLYISAKIRGCETTLRTFYDLTFNQVNQLQPGQKPW